MKLINIKENETYKASDENIFYKRAGEYIYKSYFYSKDLEDYRFEVKSIEELNRSVVEMDLGFSISYSPTNKEMNIKIRQANSTIYLDNEEVTRLLEEINEVLNNPF